MKNIYLPKEIWILIYEFEGLAYKYIKNVKQELDIFLDKMHHIDVVQVVAEDGGTGALGLSPYNIMPTAFGVNSSSKHRNYAISHNLSFFQFEDIGLSYDIDQYQDLRLATKHSFGSNTQLVVQKLFNNIH